MKHGPWEPICLISVSRPGTRFTNTFFHHRFYGSFVSFYSSMPGYDIATDFFAYSTDCAATVLSCHVQNLEAIGSSYFGWEQNEISISFELWRKSLSKMGPRDSFGGIDNCTNLHILQGNINGLVENSQRN